MSYMQKECANPACDLHCLPGERICSNCRAGGYPVLPEPVTFEECLACGGSGEARSAGQDKWRDKIPGMSGRRCKDCGGTGSVSQSQRRSQEIIANRAPATPAFRMDGAVECPACDGDGCRFCEDGRVTHAKAEAIRELIGGDDG